jgi:hypothetical protein
MGRKHAKHDVEEALKAEQALHHLESKSEEGLYPFSPVWRWKPQNGKRKGETVSLTISSQHATERELVSEGNHAHRFFYSVYKSQFPWAVEMLGQGLKTICLESRCSHNEASYIRNAVGGFFDYCKQNNVRLNSPDDFGFQLMCSWRNYLRSVEMNSRYKAVVFRRLCRVVERIMGTSLLPTKFTLPVYASDAPDPLPPYSDAVMYQLIGACVSDIENLMGEARAFEEFSTSLLLEETGHINAGCVPFVKTFLEGCSFRSGDIQNVYPDSDSRVKLADIVQQAPETKSDIVDVYKRLAEKQVPNRGSLFSFLLFFLICSGKNKETVLSWQRIYRLGKKTVSPLDWKDPLDPNKCRVRGFKSRGKGRAKIQADDTYIKVSEEGMFPILRFLIWYTEPLVSLVGERSKDSLWLYYGQRGVLDCNLTDRFVQSAQAFLQRHEIWEVEGGADGEISYVRLTSLDSRRFRKVYATKELLRAVNESQNHQELAASLAHALKHNEFDTTLGSYLSLGTPKAITDIGIFTLQEKYVEESRKFRGIRRALSKAEGVFGFYAACENPQAPDYEGAVISSGKDCQEYDMCLGCTQSRVFDEHLPRIAKRILQYEAHRETMPSDTWEAVYGRKIARAKDVLNGWTDQTAVTDAWQAAKSGSVFLPEIICRN